MAPEPAAGASLSRRGLGWLGTFQAMASPCEVHVGEADLATADRVVAIAAAEARRIEAKFSRYLRGNIIDAINTAEGRPVVVDPDPRLRRVARKRGWPIEDWGTAPPKLLP